MWLLREKRGTCEGSQFIEMIHPLTIHPSNGGWLLVSLVHVSLKTSQQHRQSDVVVKLSLCRVLPSQTFPNRIAPAIVAG